MTTTFSTSHVAVTRVKYAMMKTAVLKKKKQNKTNCYLSTHPNAILSLICAKTRHNHLFKKKKTALLFDNFRMRNFSLVLFQSFCTCLLFFPAVPVTLDLYHFNSSRKDRESSFRKHFLILHFKVNI